MPLHPSHPEQVYGTGLPCVEILPLETSLALFLHSSPASVLKRLKAGASFLVRMHVTAKKNQFVSRGVPSSIAEQMYLELCFCLRRRTLDNHGHCPRESYIPLVLFTVIIISTGFQRRLSHDRERSLSPH